MNNIKCKIHCIKSRKLLIVLGAGSDVSSMQTTARLDGDFWVLNGSKSWVTSGIEAEVAVIFATIDKTLGHKGITGLKQ